MNIDHLKKLKQKKYRQQFGHYLVEGEHLALELEKTALTDCEIFVTDHYQDWSTRFKKTIISQKHMSAIADTQTPPGIIATVPLPAKQPSPADAQAIYLHEIQDPGNLGTILRSLGWFGNMPCLLSPNSVDPYNPKVVRSSMGAIFHTRIEVDVSLENLMSRYSRFATLDMQGQPLYDGTFNNHECYLFGNEARGLPASIARQLNAMAYTIPGSGIIDSLNLASAVNISLYELHR